MISEPYDQVVKRLILVVPILLIKKLKIFSTRLIETREREREMDLKFCEVYIMMKRIHEDLYSASE